MTTMIDNPTNMETFLHSASDVLLTLSAYRSLLLIRAALISVPLIVAVRVIRRIIPDRCTWARAWCWSLLLLAPFSGKLHIWYEIPVLYRLTDFLYSLLGHHFILRLIWPAISAGLIVRALHEAFHLNREISGLPIKEFAGVSVRITPLSVSPFSAGLFRPQIVIPENLPENCDPDNIILHEQMHIRLGHLWIFALWKLLCALLFPNILLNRSTKLLREDLESLCDRVTMKHAGLSAVEYGNLILRSHRFVLEDNRFSPATLAGERTFEEARRRILRICAFKPYHPITSLLLGLCCASIVAGALVFIGQASYPRWTANPLVAVADSSGHITVYCDEEAIADAFSWDQETFVINIPAYEKLRAAEPGDVDPDHFWVFFDSFYKMPGIGGSGQVVEVDLAENVEKFVIPYERTTDFWTEFFRCM
ncbi:MAG: M56 family metallopeptidase [Lachnospiraceae bacterium]|nr:M56 family metallopeptidase [Lachnospiraceae bacterium]